MNRLSLARRTQIVAALVEGNSIRSIERMTGTHRDTVMRLLVEVGEGSAKLLDEQMRDLSCRRIQCDEIWAYVGKKQKQVTKDDDSPASAINGRSSPWTRIRRLFLRSSSASAICRPRRHS